MRAACNKAAFDGRFARGWTGLFMLALLLLAQQLHAAPKLVIHIVGSHNPELNDAVVRELRAELGRDVSVKPFSPGQMLKTTHGVKQLILTLGPAQFNDTSDSPLPARIPIVALFITRRQYMQMASGHSSTAIYYEPPLERQALLGILIFPQTSRISILSSPDYHRDYGQLGKTLLERGVTLQQFSVDNGDRLITTLDRALAFGDFLLGTPDPLIYNRSTIKHILLTTYRQGRVLIGPTQSYVGAGALASTYTTVADFVRQAVAAVSVWQKTGKMPSPAFAHRFHVIVNRQVAQSLNILVPSNDDLERKLRALEQKSSAEDKP